MAELPKSSKTSADHLVDFEFNVIDLMWNTQQAIADEMKIPRETIRDILRSFGEIEDFFIFAKGTGFRGEILEPEKDAADPNPFQQNADEDLTG